MSEKKKNVTTEKVAKLESYDFTVNQRLLLVTLITKKNENAEIEDQETILSIKKKVFSKEYEKEIKFRLIPFGQAFQPKHDEVVAKKIGNIVLLNKSESRFIADLLSKLNKADPCELPLDDEMPNLYRQFV